MNKLSTTDGGDKVELLYQSFYENTNIKITGLNALAKPIETLDTLVKRFPRKAISKLLKMQEKDSNSTFIKNYLYTCYSKTRQVQKAEAILNQTLEENPKDVFAIANKILNVHDKEEIVKHGHLLGEFRDIRTILPDREEFHIKEFTQYQLAAAHYELLINDLDSAASRVESLKQLEVKNHMIASLSHEISLAQIERFQKNLEEQQIVARQVKSFPKIEYIPVDEAPAIEHSALEVFYQYSEKDIDLAKVQELFDKYGRTLIPDLKAILTDSILRYNHFNRNKLGENQSRFMIHALYFLGALEAEEGLREVLDFLRMGEAFTKFWMNSDAEYHVFSTLYFVGKDQLGALKEFALEDNIYSWNKIMASDLVAQVAHRQPERREEVIAWFREVLTYFLRNAYNEDLIDTVFLTSAAKTVVKLRAFVLLPLIEALYKRKWIDPNIFGSMKQARTKIQKSISKSALEPLPLNLTEFYTEAYRQRKVQPEISLEGVVNTSKMLGNPASKAFMEMFTAEELEGEELTEKDILLRTKHNPPTKE